MQNTKRVPWYGKPSLEWEFSFVGKTFESEAKESLLYASKKAQKEFDRCLNEAYSRLMYLLSAKEKNKFKNAQLRWIQTRESDFSFIDSLSSLGNDRKAYQKMKIVRERAYQLKDFFNEVASQTIFPGDGER